MLSVPQIQVCQSCHGSRADRDRQVAGGAVSASSSPFLLSSVLSLPFVHPLTQEGYSEHERGVVVCTSCHTPHRGLRQAAGAAALGQRRLSIIDLGGGRQPLSNEDGTVWITFNGEIYNYKELRPQLEAKGHRFQTETDTETIVHLYEEHGENCVD